MNNNRSNISVKGAVATLGVAVLVIVASVVYALIQPPKVVSNFEECIKADGDRLESYPEQCLYNGKTYVNEEQRLPKESGYEGMTEDEALLMASDNKVPARVVERDGEGLPVTMDFVPGRQNFFVKDNVVYKVQIEGEEELAN